MASLGAASSEAESPETESVALAVGDLGGGSGSLTIPLCGEPNRVNEEFIPHQRLADQIRGLYVPLETETHAAGGERLRSSKALDKTKCCRW